jgi:serine/threonine protein kinase
MMESLRLQSVKLRYSKELSILTLLSKYLMIPTLVVSWGMLLIELLSVRLKEVIYSREDLWLVFEYMEFDLKKYMRSRGNLPLPKDKAQSFLF